MRIRISALLCSLLLITTGALAADRDERASVLGNEGELYRAEAGTYGDLFPTGTETAPESRVLALDVTHPLTGTERFLIPGTADSNGDFEGRPSLFFDDGSSTLFLVWESTRNQIHPYLQITSWQHGNWSDPLVIWSNAFALKGSANLAVTRDAYNLIAADQSETVISRTVLHLIWWEDAVGGTDVLYAPIVLQDGKYSQSQPDILRLNDFVDSENGSIAPLSLVHAPAIQPGRDHRSVLATFTDQLTGRLSTLEITVLPGELNSLADKIRGEIIEIGEREFEPANPWPFADKIRGEIIEIGARLNRQNLTFLADKIRGEIIEIGSRYSRDQVSELAARIRGEIIEIGSKIFGAEHIRLYETGENRNTVETTAWFDGLETRHQLTFHTASSRLAPAGGQTPALVYSSRSGEHALLAWDYGDDWIFYQESTDEDNWSEPRALALGNHLSRERALEVLTQRIENR